MMTTHFHQRLEELLANVPESWYGTTYPNDRRFVGRESFMDEMLTLLFGNQKIRASALKELFPEDYVRLGSPLSCIFELMRAVDFGYAPHNVYAFASRTLPLISVLLTATNPVFVYGERLVTEAQEQLLKSRYGCSFTYRKGDPQNHGPNAVVIQAFDTIVERKQVNPAVDAVLDGEGVLYILDIEKIPPHDLKDKKGKIIKEGIHTIRKRMGAPPPTPDVDARLRNQPVEPVPNTTQLKQHLKDMAGCSDSESDVLLATVGLSALGSCVMAALELGGGDIDTLMCSTAYGGSSQQTDILSRKSRSLNVNLQKHTFDIQGRENFVFEAMSGKLEAMKSGPRKPLTFIQLEYPTNPDMKDCDLKSLASSIIDYRQTTGSEVIMLLDTTFSPPSKSAQFFRDVPVIVFNSLSKSVSGGLTTGGSLVANNHPLAKEIMKLAFKHLALLDTSSKGCQQRILSDMHHQCEERVRLAHNNTISCATHLEETVRRLSGEEMKVNFVSAAQMSKGVTPATFSFNLPAPVALRGNYSALAALAQSFVDGLVEEYPTGIKPCVSFGQSNSLVYVTVPATSTQGVISEEDKAKQAVGGVQLVRFSFPPTMNITNWENAINGALQKIYGRLPSRL